MKFLVIEDNLLDVELLKAVLVKGGTDFELVHACTLQEGINFAKGSTYDAVLLDLGLPDAWGVRAIRKFRAAEPCLPLLVLSGVVTPERRAEAIAAGANGCLMKGEFECKELLQALGVAGS